MPYVDPEKRHEHMNHGASLKQAALRPCEHPNCAPYREWLAGNKEDDGAQTN